MVQTEELQTVGDTFCSENDITVFAIVRLGGASDNWYMNVNKDTAGTDCPTNKLR
jgi:hypothetical protein